MGRNKKKSIQTPSPKMKSTPNKQQKNSRLNKESLNTTRLEKSKSFQSETKNAVDCKTIKTSQKRRRESGDELQISAPSAKRSNKDNQHKPTKNSQNTTPNRKKYQRRKASTSETGDNETNKILTLEDLENDQTIKNMTHYDRIETGTTTSNHPSSSKSEQSPPSRTQTSGKNFLAEHEEGSHLMDADWEDIHWEGLNVLLSFLIRSFQTNRSNLL
jgi:hypothetical protein